MDVGKSLNPAIDVGQIEGAFVQGYGLFCLEQVKVGIDIDIVMLLVLAIDNRLSLDDTKVMSKTGQLLTRGPGAYKIPGFRNIPQEFNVTLLKDSPNVRAVYSSKVR